jgi:hypothetical protein
MPIAPGKRPLHDRNVLVVERHGSGHPVTCLLQVAIESRHTKAPQKENASRAHTVEAKCRTKPPSTAARVASSKQGPESAYPARSEQWCGLSDRCAPALRRSSRRSESAPAKQVRLKDLPAFGKCDFLRLFDLRTSPIPRRANRSTYIPTDEQSGWAKAGGTPNPTEVYYTLNALGPTIDLMRRRYLSHCRPHVRSSALDISASRVR